MGWLHIMDGGERARQRGKRGVPGTSQSSFDHHFVNKQTQERSFLRWHGWETGLLDCLFRGKQLSDWSCGLRILSQRDYNFSFEGVKQYVRLVVQV